jgi:hypothetical protein
MSSSTHELMASSMSPIALLLVWQSTVEEARRTERGEGTTGDATRGGTERP